MKPQERSAGLQGRTFLISSEEVGCIFFCLLYFQAGHKWLRKSCLELLRICDENGDFRRYNWKGVEMIPLSPRDGLLSHSLNGSSTD